MKITQQFLTKNPFSRPGNKLIGVRGVVIHWVANPNTTASANRNFFENRKFGKTNYGSAHYIVNLNGDIIQCLPENEVGYHVGSNTYTSAALRKLSSYPNNCTIGIECTHIDWNGKMNSATYNETLKLAVHLLKKYKLTENDLWLHKTVVGWKPCHLWFVNNNAEWVKFKRKAGEMLRGKAQLNPEVNTKDMIHPAPNSDGTYTVRKGDTFWGISKQLDIPVETIQKLNPGVKATELKVGQKIKVKNTGGNSSGSGSKPASKPNTTSPSSSASGRVESKVNGLRFYNRPSWDDKDVVGIVNKGVGFPTIVKKVKVGNGYQYHVKNSRGNTYYITASDQYVKVVGGGSSNAKPASKPKPTPKKKYVQLPKTSSSWRVYPTNKSPVKGNEKGYLNPKKFNGLEYQVLGNPQKDVYTIKTGDFGTVNIYAAPSTGAKIIQK